MWLILYGNNYTNVTIMWQKLLHMTKIPEIRS